MSKKANPTLIGIFVLGGLFLTVVAILFVGSMNFLAKEERFVLYFESSVNGLAKGAPIKFKGVPIGRVEEIKIRWNQSDDSSAIPVFVKIDTRRLKTELGVDVDLGDPDVLRRQVLAGLRAQLVLESFITGLLFIEMDYHDSRLPPRFVQLEFQYKEIPTVQSTLAEIGETANTIVSKIMALDVEGINNSVLAILEKVEVILDELQVGDLNASLLASSEAVRKRLEELDVGAMQDEALALIRDLRATVGDARGEINPLIDNIDLTLVELRATLSKAQGTLEEVDGLMSPDHIVLQRLREALEEVADTARSARFFIDTVQRNPQVFITGKAYPEGN